jgi:anti-sigma regulatory factor (Ser/Thr protein kinase)
MATAALYGLSPREGDALAAALRRSGWESGPVVPGSALPTDLDALVSGLERTSLVVAGVRSGGDAVILSRCVHLEPDRIFAAGVGGSGELSLAALALDLRGRLFFLPPREAEAERVFRECRGAAREVEARRSVARGMRRHELSLDIPTAELHVGEVAAYLADRLRDSGFSADPEGRRRAGLALEEALLNAVEHGNLELDSRLRSTEAVGEDPYEVLRLARLADPRYAARRVRIRLGVDGECATLEVSDDGRGFGGEAAGAARTGELMGRGMALIRRAFDTVEHRGSTLVLRCRKEQRDATGHTGGG